MEAIVTCALCVVLCVLAQILLYELYSVRTAIFTRVYFSNEVVKPDSEMQSIMGEPPGYMTIDDRGVESQSYEKNEAE